MTTFSRNGSAGKFGYFGFTPSWLQWLNNPWSFLAGVATLTFAQLTAIVGLLITLMPQIEKRFNLSGFDSGMIFVANDVAAVIFGVLIGHYGSIGNKVKWIGIGGLISGAGFVIFTLPHFIIGRYDPPAATVPQMFCSPKMNNTLGEPTCAGKIADWYYLALLLIGQFVVGLGSIPLYSLAPTCFQEATSAKTLPIFFGIWQAAVNLAPLFAFTFSKPLLKSYVDINQPDGFNMTPFDPRWISNWWVGFLGAAGVCILSGLFIVGFPARIVNNGMVDVQDGENDNDHVVKSLGEIFIELSRSVKDILSNWTFLFNCMAVNTLLMYMEGMSPFLAKLLMLKYGVAPADIGEAFTITMLPPLVVGTLFSIVLTRHFKEEASGKQSALLCLVIQGLIIVAPLVFLVPGCDNINLAGLEIPYGARAVTQRGINFTAYPDIPGVQLRSTCNKGCGCDLGIALPVCGSDNITYLSPCYAGCALPLSPTKFGNCSCIGPDNGYGGTATVGYCDRNCKNWLVFLSIFALAAMFIFALAVPSKMVIMSCIPPDKISLAFAVQYMMTKIFAHIPGPILFGHLIDINCDIWQTVCDKTGYCWIYDVDKKVKMVITTASSLYGALYRRIWAVSVIRILQKNAVVRFGNGGIIKGKRIGLGVLLFFLSWFFYKDAVHSVGQNDRSKADQGMRMEVVNADSKR